MNRDQLLAILWLRWRLTRNQFAKGSGLNAFVSALLAVLLAAGAAGAAIGGFFFAWLAMGDAPAPAMLAMWDVAIFAFLLVWFTGLVVEIQRSESIDLTRLLHLPVGLRQVFILNYIASHASPAIILFISLAVGLSAGLCFSRSFWLVAMIAVAAAFVFFLSSWTYGLRGWLAALMINKRRRRTIVVWITIIFILIFQIPNLLINSGVFRNRNHRAGGHAAQSHVLSSDEVLAIHLALPPGWVGYSAVGLDKKNPLPAVASIAGCVLLGWLGLRRAYRSTLRFYTDDGKKAALAASPKHRAPVSAGRILTARRLPFARDDTAALAWATFQSMLRAPELKMAAIMPIIIIAGMLSAHIFRAKGSPHPALALLAPSLIGGVANFGFVNVMGNIFGLDRNGFRALVLLPTPRRRILLGKNLAFFPFVFGTSILLLIPVALWLRIGWLSCVAGLLQTIISFLLFSLACNTLSIMSPYRFAPGSLQMKKPKSAVFMGMILTMMAVPLIMVPATVPPLAQLALAKMGLLPWFPANLVLTLLLLELVLLLYSALLPAQGRLLQKREQRILDEVTHETE